MGTTRSAPNTGFLMWVVMVVSYFKLDNKLRKSCFIAAICVYNISPPPSYIRVHTHSILSVHDNHESCPTIYFDDYSPPPLSSDTRGNRSHVTLQQWMKELSIDAAKTITITHQQIEVRLWPKLKCATIITSRWTFEVEFPATRSGITTLRFVFLIIQDYTFLFQQSLVSADTVPLLRLAYYRTSSYIVVNRSVGCKMVKCLFVFTKMQFT